MIDNGQVQLTGGSALHVSARHVSRNRLILCPCCDTTDNVQSPERLLSSSATDVYHVLDIPRAIMLIIGDIHVEGCIAEKVRFVKMENLADPKMRQTCIPNINLL